MVLDQLTVGPWTISLGLAQALIDVLEELQPRNILEFGSGNSSVIFGSHARRTGAKVTSLENSRLWHKRTLELLDKCDMHGLVNVRRCPITQVVGPDDEEHPIYVTALDDDYDFVFIDGPPGRIGRDGAMFQVAAHLAPHWTAWLDDGDRPAERACVELWQRYIKMAVEYRPLPKGLWVMHDV